jgi:pimeloyl-ACP methyl ester carboxylesterase
MKYSKPAYRWFKISFRVFVTLVVLFILACFVFDHFVQFRMNDEELLSFFQQNKVKGEIRYYTKEGRKIRYISVGNDSLPTLLFIHGSPSSISFFKEYFKDSLFLKTFKMYAVDRPGYGFSGFGKAEPSIEKQAAIIRPILDNLNKVRHPVILVAASYGSSIACRMAMDYPQLVDGLVLIGPSLAPGEEKMYWFTPAIENPMLSWFIPRMFQSANTEKLHHQEGLASMLPLWQNIKVPVMYLQGSKDELIYTSNAVFAKKKLINAPCLDIHFFEGLPHFIEFRERPAIRKKILEMLALIKPS